MGNGFYFLQAREAGSVWAGGGYLIRLSASANRITEFAQFLDSSSWFYRIKSQSGWTDWKEVSFNIPSFYKDYNSLASLANALGVVYEQRLNAGANNTGVNVVGGNCGKTLIIIGSLNGGAEDSTGSYIKMIRCPYSGATIHITTIAEDYKDAYCQSLVPSISVDSSGNLIFTDNSGTNYVKIIENK